jgi:hypothetical protein
MDKLTFLWIVILCIVIFFAVLVHNFTNKLKNS